MSDFHRSPLRRISVTSGVMLCGVLVAGCTGGGGQSTGTVSGTSPGTATGTGTGAGTATPSGSASGSASGSGASGASGSQTSAGGGSTATAPPIKVNKAWHRSAEKWFVWGVAGGDVLNARRDAGTAYPIVGKLTPGQKGITVYDVTKPVGRALWQPVAIGTGAGWVNVRYLRPQGPAVPSVKGVKTTALATAAGVARTALMTGDLNALAGIAHPTKGVTFSAYAYTSKESPVITQAQLRAASSDTTDILWGYTDGEGAPIRATMKGRLTELGGSTALTSTHTIGYDVVLGSGNSINNIAQWFPKAHVVEYFFPGTKRWAGMDWESLRFVFDTSGATPLLIGVVRDMWTI